jgi:branched-chain amino acid transport system ATP-binding protein
MRFGGLTAVKGIDLTVGEREIVGLIGPNGAGKTTFFNCLTCLYVPTEGEVRYRGARLPGKPHEVTRAGVARTFQNIRLQAPAVLQRGPAGPQGVLLPVQARHDGGGPVAEH